MLVKDHYSCMPYLIRTTRFWNNLHQVRSQSKDWKTKQFKVLGTIKPKTLNSTMADSMNVFSYSVKIMDVRIIQPTTVSQIFTVI